jgi:hypothetical protein
MPIPFTGILDTFNRSNTGPPPGPGWSSPIVSGQSGLVTSSNACIGSSTSWRDAYWSTSFGRDQEVYCTVANVPEGQMFWHARIRDPGGTTHDSYWARYTPAGASSDYRIGKVVNGTYSTITTFTNMQMSVGTKVALQVEGNSPTTLRLYHDTGSGWTLIGETTDSEASLNDGAGGYIGLECNFSTAANDAAFDDFGGGDLKVKAGAIASATSGTTVTPVLPTHKTGDILVVLGAKNDAGTLSCSGGWTVIDAAQSDSNLSTGAWYKVAASGSETNPTITSSTSATATNGLYGQAFVGDSNYFSEIADGTWNGSPTSSTTPAGATITTTQADSVAVTAALIDSDNAFASGLPPSGWTALSNESATNRVSPTFVQAGTGVAVTGASATVTLTQAGTVAGDLVLLVDVTDGADTNNKCNDLGCS